MPVDLHRAPAKKMPGMAGFCAIHKHLMSLNMACQRWEAFKSLLEVDGTLH